MRHNLQLSLASVLGLTTACAAQSEEPYPSYPWGSAPVDPGDARSDGDGMTIGDTQAGDSGPGGGDSCPAAEPLSTCLPMCDNADDCAVEQTSGGAYGADNYACVEGVCRWRGCWSDAECAVTLAASGRAYRCMAPPCSTIRTCYPACTAAADCVIETTLAGAYGADNYACEGGVCEYRGCLSHAECASSFSTTGEVYRCTETAGGISTCQQQCTAAVDCVVGDNVLYDADNWQCESNGCRWMGCWSQAECQQGIGSGYACSDYY